MTAVTKQNYHEVLNELKDAGWSSRQMAQATGLSKSAINYFFQEQRGEKRKRKKNKKQVEVSVKQPKILILDLETSADIVATFGRRQINISEANILQQGNQIISAAWMWAPAGKIESKYSTFEDFSAIPRTEMELLRTLYNLLEEADAVVIHNARFDLGTIQHRGLFYGFGKIPTVKVIDTLMLARKHLSLRSNKLDAITKYFGLSNKMENEGIKLWIDVQSGDPEAMQRMLEYNEADVQALRDVYFTFLPLSSTFNQGLVVEASSPVCGACGSANVKKTGRLVRKTVTAYEEYECMDCHSRLQGRKNVITKEQSRNILVPL